MTPEEQEAKRLAEEKQLRDLATQITQMSKLGFDPGTFRKGVIAAVSDAATPPTVSVNLSGDATTLITDVRIMDNQTPVVGSTALIAKQGSDIFLLGSIAASKANGAPTGQTESTGWIKPTLSNGTHGGSGNDVYYRRVLDHGSWKVQWRGTWNTSGSSTMLDSGDALDADYRPSSTRQIACARENDGISIIRADFTSAGLVTIHQGTTSSSTDGSHGHSFSDIYGDIGQFTTGNGTNSGGSHSHLVSFDHPNWVSLNGVEYFL